MEQTSTAVMEQQQARKDRSLEATLRKFNDAFNRFDAKEVAACWAEDGTLISPLGHYGRGRAEIARVFGEDAGTILRGTTSTFTIAGARQIGEDCELLDLDHEIQNARRPDGTTGAMTLHVVMLAQKKKEGWQFLDARPYAFMQRPPELH
jgi:uncharacterized protein (TIGR02246 family)